MQDEIEIIFENDEMLVVNKPAGLLVHGDGRGEEVTLADWLLEQYPNLTEVGESWENEKGEVIPRPGIVHRLDRETSGVMVVAKTQETFVHLKKQFQERLVRKTYHAFVWGALKEEEGEIDRPITKSKSDFRLWSAQPGGRGVARKAHTSWRLLGHMTSENNEEIAYVELAPTTGRTHQLRVHMKALHHPIVCDSLYAPKRGCALGFERLALHAYTLVLEDAHGTEHTFTAEFPEDFERADALQKNHD